MNGNFARSILCSLVTSVDLGWYSSIVGVGCCCGDWACCVIAGRGQTRNAAEAATRIVETKKMVRREFIVPLWTFELPANHLLRFHDSRCRFCCENRGNEE